MSQELHYLAEKLQDLNRRWLIFGGCLLCLFLGFLGYFGIFRPFIVMTTLTGQGGAYIKNSGHMDALIYRVDAFWYWGDKVAVLGNMPHIQQRLKRGDTPLRLHLPVVPVHDLGISNKTPLYMKLVVRYTIPRIPVFRYTTLMYFKCDPDHKRWAPTKTIPPRYRALGQLTTGNVAEIKARFH